LYFHFSFKQTIWMVLVRLMLHIVLHCHMWNDVTDVTNEKSSLFLVLFFTIAQKQHSPGPWLPLENRWTKNDDTFPNGKKGFFLFPLLLFYDME
jgi:hypothetical protein